MCVTQQEKANRSAVARLRESCRKQASKHREGGGWRGYGETSAEGVGCRGPGRAPGSGLGAVTGTKVEGGLGEAEKPFTGGLVLPMDFINSCQLWQVAHAPRSPLSLGKIGADGSPPGNPSSLGRASVPWRPPPL